MFDAANGPIAPYLAPDERILWQGRSRRRFWGAPLGVGALLLTVFVGIGAAMFVVFGFLAERSANPNAASQQGILIVFTILPLIFVVVGLAVGLPLLIVGRQLGNNQYYVTSEAAIIVSESRWFGRRLTVAPLANLPMLSLSENRDGTGSILFGTSPYLTTANTRYNGGLWSGSLPAFWNIEQPREVYRLIRQQARERGKE